MSDGPGLFEELKRRNVFRAAAMYAVVGWLLIQIGEATFDAMGLPAGSLRFLIIAVAAGFPVALVIGWLFDWTSKGLVRTSADPEEEVARLRTSRRVDYAIIGVLTLGLGMALFGPEIERSDAATSIRSLAVLPLSNLSGDSEQEYFSDGMTEAVIGELAKIGSLRVISRTSVMRYKHSELSLPDIAAQLGVDAVIEGSVLRDNDRIRVSAQLVHGTTDRNLWAERFDRQVQDVLELQSEIARAIAREIRLELTAEETAGLDNQRRVDPLAYESYLKARFEVAKFTAEGVQAAIEHYEEAIHRDPQYARAHAGLGIAWFMLGQPMEAASHAEVMPRAKAAALRALELDGDLGEAHTALAFVSWIFDWSWDAAEHSFRRAIELNPGSPEAHWGYGIFLSTMGRHEEAIASGMRAVEVDPFSLTARSVLAEYFVYSRDYERALREADEVLELAEDHRWALLVKLWAHEARGDYVGAIEARGRLEGLSPEGVREASQRFASEGSAGYRGWVLGRLEAVAGERYVDPVEFAVAHAWLGDRNAALRWLEGMYEERNGSLTFLGVSPQWDTMRSDPRFQDLVRRVGLPAQADPGDAR